MEARITYPLNPLASAASTAWGHTGLSVRTGTEWGGRHSALTLFDAGLGGRHVQKVDSGFVTTGYAASDGVGHERAFIKGWRIEKIPRSTGVGR
jgi:hypothetical protein